MIKDSDKKQLKNYFLWATIIILIILSYYIIKDFIIPIITAFVLAYLCLPFFNKLKPNFGKKISATICLLIVFLVVIIPIGAITTGVITQAKSSLRSNQLESITQTISENQFAQKLNIDVSDISQKIINFTIDLVSSAASKLPSLIITLIIIALGVFYILIDWDELIKHLKSFFPFENKNQAMKEIKNSTNGIIYGSVLISLIEFVISLIGFYISGVQFFLFLPVIIFFLGFIPGLGPTIVWVPLAIYYAATGQYLILAGVLITGIILSLGVDTILRSKIMGKKANIHPFIMIIGIMGGIKIFGIFGFIIGPLILIYAIKIIQEVINN